MTGSSPPLPPSSHREIFHVPVDPDLEYEEVMVHPDEIKLGDILAGYVVTGIAGAEHYRSPGIRITIFTDPYSLPDGVEPEEWGRIVFRTDRAKGHKIPVMRAIRD